MKNLVVKPLKSKIITVKDDLSKVVHNLLKSAKLKEKDILVITSKIVAITQNRVKKIKSQKEFDQLVKAESDQFIGGKEVSLTIKDNIFIPWAGIDRSNAPENTAILWPKESFKVAEEICKKLKKAYKLKQFGVIITDSFCVPLRKGTIGIALAYAGFDGVNDLRGKKDLQGRPLKVTQQAMADMLASAAHVVMGESNEQTPFALIQNAPVKFITRKINPNEAVMKMEECLYAPLFKDIL